MVERKSPKFTVQEFVFLASAFSPLDKYDQAKYQELLERKHEEKR